MLRKLIPIVLCGGVGKRLWPVSRQSYPKQFSKILGDRSLFQNTVELFNDPRFEPPLILTNNDYRFIIENQLEEVSIKHSGIIIEPFQRDTAPTILAAALYLVQRLENPILLILPSDHTFGDKDELKSLICSNSKLAELDEIISFGIEPNRIETGYGWIEYSKHTHLNTKLSRVKRFHEKPDKKIAEHYFKQGDFLWNSGIYLFSAKTIINSFQEHIPKLFPLVLDSVNCARKDLGFIRLDEISWGKIKPISIDYAIIEKASNLLVAKYKFEWDDLGDWDAVWRENQKDKNGIVSFGPVFYSNCKDSYLRSDNPNQQLVAIGCEDMVVVSMFDAVLVSRKDQVQQVKDAINILHETGQSNSRKVLIEYRNWGKFESILCEDKVQINRLTIQPGKKIILQRHSLRTEHWVVIKGKAQIILGTEKIILEENQSFYIPKGTKHSLHNSTDQILIIMEIQTGEWIEEDDIERFANH